MPLTKLLFQPTIILALVLMTIIVMMILPMPSWVLDFGLAVSFGLAILIFTITLFIQKPLDFSVFPTILLASLMLRLSLNVSSTKLIIGQGHTGTQAAGGVIEGFAMFVMGGNIFLGLVIFGVLLIVNLAVITKGAARMAEVGARFALDGMPGKQLAIDSDVASGAISHEEAKARREKEQAETTFFGSLDGASKFVKGDAIAGLMITILNLVVGVVMGTIVHNMGAGQAFETYAILTVGDGLVNQIPSVIISIASGLLLARGGASGSTDSALTSQMGKHPTALLTVGVLMIIFAVFPGLPFFPFLIGAAGLLIAAWITHTNAHKAQMPAQTPQTSDEAISQTMGDVLNLDDIHVEFAPDLVSMVLDPAAGIDARIMNMRTHIAQSYGVILPEIRLTDDASLPQGHYTIRVHGVQQAHDRLRTDQVLVILPAQNSIDIAGEDVSEPVYGAPARWIAQEAREKAVLAGLTAVSPTEVLSTHILETVKRNFGRLLTHNTLRKLLDEITNLSNTDRAEANKRLLGEMIPDKVPMDLLITVLRLLLEEQVSIRNLGLIIESIAEARPVHTTPESITEYVRQRLGFQLIADLRRPDGSIALVQLAPEWEDIFTAHHIDRNKSIPDVALPPEKFNQLANALAEKISTASETGDYPAVITSTLRRRFLRTVLLAKGLPNPVLSFDEIGIDARPALVGLVGA